LEAAKKAAKVAKTCPTNQYIKQQREDPTLSPLKIV